MAQLKWEEMVPKVNGQIMCAISMQQVWKAGFLCQEAKILK